MTLRLALDLQAARSQRTGIGSYAVELAQALRQYEDVTVLPVDWGHDPVMNVLRRLQWQQWELPRRAKASGADLLHVTGFDAPWWQPLPTVVTVHDLIGKLFPQNLPLIARMYWQFWLPWSVRWASQIIADSACTQHDIMRLLGVPAARITVVPLGVDRGFVPQSDAAIAEVRDRLGLPERMVLYVGTLEPRKGIDTLLDAWSTLAARFPDARLVLGGKRGWYVERLQAQTERLGLTQRVQWLDYVAAEDLPALYSAAEVFVFPSRYEGFGLPPLEAMACGTPVVSSDAAALPEVVGEAGLLVPPDAPDALARMIALVLGQPALQRELRQRGVQQANPFTWERTAALTRAVYERALAASGQDAGGAGA